MIQPLIYTDHFLLYWISHSFTWRSCFCTWSADLVNGSVVNVYGSAVIVHGSAIDVYRSVFIAFEFWIIHPFTRLSCSCTCSANLVNGSVVSIYGSAVIVYGSADNVRKCIWFSYWCIQISIYRIWVFHSFTWLSCSCTCSTKSSKWFRCYSVRQNKPAFFENYAVF